jgi:flagellar hook-length control protein FliK
VPEISSLPPVAPAAPAAAPVTPAAPAAPVAGSTDPAATDFLAQLTAVLKTLAGAVTVSQPSGAPTTLASTAAATGQAPIQPEPKQKEGDSKSDELTEIMASLGIAITPPQVQPIISTGSGASDAPALPVVKSAPQEAVAPRPTSAPAPAAKHDIANAPRTDMPQGAAAPQPTAPDQPPAEPNPNPNTSDAPAPAALTLQPHGQASTSFGSSDLSDSSGFNQSGDRREQHAPSALTSAPDPLQASPAGGDQALATSVVAASANAAPASASAAASAAPPVHPSQVVSQIVHQAELFRLPGNKGLRIQLHPDDLGGVQVTMRYAAGGGIELHINVEHAATGSLLQSGWTELRDALATHGITPDRLVMSVTAPIDAGQLDFSSNGGGSYRSDPSLTSFMQGGGQSGQQRQDGGDDARVWRGWNGGAVEPVTSSDDNSRAATSSAASRIDYRA